jgi:hypothetical protein
VGRRVADEFVLVPLARRGTELDSIFNLNPVAAFLWEQLDGIRDGHALVGALVERYEVEHDEASRDYLELLAQLIEIGAVVRA